MANNTKPPTHPLPSQMPDWEKKTQDANNADRLRYLRILKTWDKLPPSAKNPTKK